MSWFTDLFTPNLKEPVEAIGGVLDELFTSDDERANAKIVMEKLRQEPGKLQAAIGKIQAQHRSIFVAGARPFLMWVCGLGMFNAFLINPWIQWLTGEPGPALPLTVMAELVTAMLGLSVLRTVEKMNGKSK